MINPPALASSATTNHDNKATRLATDSALPPTLTAALDAAGNGIGVEFTRLSDRYSHQIRVIRAGVAGRIVLASHEGPAHSPALQELRIEQLPDGKQFAALVGMSDANHWSLTIESQIVGGRPRLLFDAACRMKTPLPQVANRYDVVDDAHVCVELPAIDGQPASEVVTSSGNLRVVREIAPTEAPPATLRWRYAVSLR